MCWGGGGGEVSRRGGWVFAAVGEWKAIKTL